MKYLLMLSLISLLFLNAKAEDFWMRTNFTETTYDVFCPNNDEVFIVFGSDTYLSHDMGSSWDKFLDYRTYYINNTSEEFYTSYWDSLFVFNRNTETWNFLYDVTGVGIIRIYGLDDNFIIRGYSKLLKSDLDWSNIYTVFDVEHGGEELTCFVVDSAGTYYTGSTDFMNIDDPGGVYKSYDNGETWTYPDLPEHFVRAMSVDSEGRIFVGTCGHYTDGTGHVFRSEDNGDTWETVAYGTYVLSMSINSDDEIFIGLDSDGGYGGVAYSEDHGETWSLLDQGFLGGDIFDIAISPDGYVYLATRTGVYRSINSTTGIDDSDELFVVSYELEQNYPNPFNNETSIEYALQNMSEVEINIFNSTGQFVQNLINERQMKGKYSVSFKAKELNSGVYYYRLEIDGVVKETRKMLYLR